MVKVIQSLSNEMITLLGRNSAKVVGEKWVFAGSPANCIIEELRREQYIVGVSSDAGHSIMVAMFREI